MSLQLIMGNSGSGKTHYLYESVIKESLENPTRNYLIIVPEQYTMQTQKEVVMRHPRGGIMNIDVLSFGGTKNGMMFGEAVLFFNTSFVTDVPYIRKQSMQLHSKTRFIAAQFSAVLKNNLWLKTASHANRMAQQLASEAAQIPGIRITQEVGGNEVFAIIPREKISLLQEACFFYTWDESASEVRWVCSFDTTENDILEFVYLLRQAIC